MRKNALPLMSGKEEEEKWVKFEWIERDIDEYKISRWMNGGNNEWMHEKNTWMNAEGRMWKRIFKLL
jgi:hypothetical protein